MEEVTPIVAIVSVFGSIILFVTVLINYSLKKKLIEKNMVNEETANMFKSMTTRQSILKWGLIILFAGLGLIIVDNFLTMRILFCLMEWRRCVFRLVFCFTILWSRKREIEFLIKMA